MGARAKKQKKVPANADSYYLKLRIANKKNVNFLEGLFCLKLELEIVTVLGFTTYK